MKHIKTINELASNLTEGISKSAIKKQIKIIDQMIEDEEGGGGEPLTSETLQALEQEQERLKKMLKEGTLIDLRLVNENVEDEIELALTNWLNVLADGNAVKITDLYLENGVLLGTLAKEIKQGHEQIQQYFERFLAKSPIGSIDTFILQNFGDICISDGTYTFEVDGENGRESVSARYTYVWKKENKKWMIATHHSSAQPK